MNILETDLQAAANLVASAQKILLVSHRRPDGDTLGACIAMHFGLTQMGKKTTLACIDEIPDRFSFLTDLLDQKHQFVNEFDPEAYDLYIICDAGAHHMTGFHEEYPSFLSKKVPIINIDHHFSNDGFGTVNLVDSKTSCAAMVVWGFLKKLPVKFTKEMAIALLTGIYNDTGGFMYSNTDRETFEVANDLAKLGVSVTDIVRPLFKESTMAQLRLWGYILENLKKNEKNIVSSVVTDSDFKTIGAHASDTGGIVDLMNTVPGSAFVMLLAEDEGWVKGSLRTQRDNVNLSDIASEFGGGGHPKASGFRVQGRLEKQIVWKIVPAV